MDNRSRTFKVNHRPQQTYPGVTVSCPSSVTVPRGGSADFKIRLIFNPIASGRADVFDNGSISQSEVDGWCVLEEGKDSLRVGYLAVVDAASRDDGVDAARSGKSQRLFNLGPAPGIAEGFTFAASGGADHSADEDKPGHAFDQTGFRTAAPGIFDPFEVAEIGISLKQKFEHLSDVSFEMDIDVDGDGVPEVALRGCGHLHVSGCGRPVCS